MPAKLLMCVFLATAHGLLAQGFINTTFERPPFPQPPAPSGTPQFLDWATWAPGWSHSSGSDTGVLYYELPHLGISQWYLLVRNPGSINYGTPLAGAYSLAMHSGYLNNQDVNSGWTEAFISQTAVVPAGTLSLRFLASRPIAVQANGTPVPLYSLGGNLWAGDFSAYAGLSTELRLMNVTTPGDFATPPTILDNITFSTTPVPEPAGIVPFLPGAAANSLS